MTSFSMLLFLAMSAVALSIWNSLESSQNAIAINMAGKQRMLTQQIEKNLLKLSYAQQQHSDISGILQELSQSYHQFDKTLSMLHTGRLIAPDGQAFTLDIARSPKILDLLEQANSRWLPIHDALKPVIESTAPLSSKTLVSGKTLESAVSSVTRHNPQLLLLMNSITTEIEHSTHKKSNRLRGIEALTLALCLINFGFVLFYFRRQLSQLSESRLLSMRIMENAGAAITVINAKGEIELCNHAAEHIFGYSCGTLAGTNIINLIDEPFYLQIGKRSNGERFALDIDLNEIDVSGRRLFIASLSDITEQKFKEEQLSLLAYHDPLTGLPNRLLFMDRLNQTIARAHRNDEMVAVLFIDLDRFKQVNDLLGHATGDLLLKDVASRLRSCLREGDTLTRMGGDEFTLIIEVNDLNNCTTISQKILSELNKVFYLNDHIIRISGSIGASLYPNDSCDLQALLHYADIAMYRAKSQGGNVCCKYAEIEPAPHPYQLMR